MSPLLSAGIFLIFAFSWTTNPVESKLQDIQALSDLEVLLDGVESISIAGSPGFISVYGSTAFPVVAGRASPSDVYHPVAAATPAGKGRLLGFAHDAFLNPEVTSTGAGPTDKNRFILNSLRWAGSRENVSVLLVSNIADDPIMEFLSNNSIRAIQVELANLTVEQELDAYEVVFVKEFFDVDKVPLLQEYLDNGGGLILGLTSWAYYYFLNVTGNFGSNFPGNMISEKYGFVWRSDAGDSIAVPTTPEGNYNTSMDYLMDLDVPRALEQIRQFVINGSIEQPAGPPRSILQYSSLVSYGLEVIPPYWQIFDYNDALNLSRTSGQPVVSQENPVVDLTDKFFLEVFHAFSAFALEPNDVPAHPASLVFPGPVPQDELDASEMISTAHQVKINFKRPSWFKEYQLRVKNVWSYVPDSINKCNSTGNTKRTTLGTNAEEQIKVSNKLPLWFSTGLYAAAGEVVTINIVEASSDNRCALCQIQIGSHTDDVSHLSSWFRNPRLIVRKSFVDNKVEISSPYGGLIYVMIPENSVSDREDVVLMSVTGAVKAPYFRLGETPVKKWREEIRNSEGPWAEFVTENIAITVPSQAVRELDDPEDLLLFWDQVMDAIADLAAIPRERYRQERMVADVQISAGFMHSGYPIMTFLNEGSLAVNVTELRTKGSWGHFHELGHNHQNGDWTFSGTGEVTVNLFSLYILNTVCGIRTEDTRAEMTPDVYREKISNYIVGGLNFEQWKSDPWLALMFYVQLQKVYGWTAYKQVFAEYHLLGDGEHPQTDQDKMDKWLIIFSSVVEENLSFFFQSWGVPVTENATSTVASFPEARIRIFDLLSD